MRYRGIEGKKEFNTNEKKLIDYCIEIGYKVKVCKQYQSKTVFTIDLGEDVLDSYEIPNVVDYKFNPTQFQRGIDNLKELTRMRREFSK